MVRISDLLSVSNESSLLNALDIVPPHPKPRPRGQRPRGAGGSPLLVAILLASTPGSALLRSNSSDAIPSPGFVTAAGTSCFQVNDLQIKYGETAGTMKVEAPGACSRQRPPTREPRRVTHPESSDSNGTEQRAAGANSSPPYFFSGAPLSPGMRTVGAVAATLQPGRELRGA